MEQVLWQEGIVLAQQHLQKFDESIKLRQDFLTASNNYNYGLLDLTIDLGALTNNCFKILTLSYILPNKTVITYNHKTDKELFLSLADNTDNVTVHLCCNDDYYTQYKIVTDRYNIESEVEVAIAKPDLHLSLLANTKDYCYCQKLVDLKFSHGRYLYDSNKFYTLLNLNIAENIILNFNNFLKTCDDRLKRELCDTPYPDKSISFEHYEKNILIEALYKFKLELQLILDNNNVKPQDLYQICLNFVSKAIVISNIKEFSFPKYDHNNISDCFNKILQIISQILNHKIHNSVSKLDLVKNSDNLYTLSLPEIFYKDNHELYLELAGVNKEALPSFTKEVKIAAKSNIDLILTSASSGVMLEHVYRPQGNLPGAKTLEYFALKQSGIVWQQILLDKQLVVFVSNNYKQAKINFYSLG